MKFVLPVLICVVLSATNGFAAQWVDSPQGDISAQWYIGSGPIRLSDTISLVLNVDHDLALDVPTQVFADSLGDFRIVGISPSPIRIENEREYCSWTISLVPGKNGKNVVGAIPILYRNNDPPESPWETLLVPPQELEIDSSVSEQSTLSDITGAVPPIRVYNRSFYYWLLGIIIAAIALFFVRNEYRRRKITIIGQVQYTPTQIAMRKLAALLDSRLYERDVKAFYVEMTDIVRWFIEQKTNISAPELTTEEFLREISKRMRETEPLQASTSTATDLIVPQTGRFAVKTGMGIRYSTEEKTEDEATNSFFSSKTRYSLASFLETADLVKFAKFQPNTTEIMTGFRKASEFIELGTYIDAGNNVD